MLHSRLNHLGIINADILMRNMGFEKFLLSGVSGQALAAYTASTE